MDRVVLKKGCRSNKTIVDCYNVIEEGVHIGAGSDKPYLRSYVDSSGISVIASERQALRV